MRAKLEHVTDVLVEWLRPQYLLLLITTVCLPFVVASIISGPPSSPPAQTQSEVTHTKVGIEWLAVCRTEELLDRWIKVHNQSDRSRFSGMVSYWPGTRSLDDCELYGHDPLVIEKRGVKNVCVRRVREPECVLFVYRQGKQVCARYSQSQDEECKWTDPDWLTPQP
jgi:hypothetical protein